MIGLRLVIPGFIAAAGMAPALAGSDLRSQDGALSVTLVASAGKVAVGDLELDGQTYNGEYAGPVLRVRPGDMLAVRLVNDLPQPTNLHFHGIQTSPLGYSDNIHISVAPGDSFTYRLRIPAAQPPGLYWYHSHMHGVSEAQVMQGLSGTLIVEGTEPQQAAERLFVLKDMEFEDDTDNPRIDDDLHGVVMSVNGGLDATEAMRPGETQMWRFTNQSANLPFRIALQGHRFRVIAEDGGPVTPERVTDVLDIPPARRFDVLVESGAEGRYALLARGMVTGTGTALTPDRTLGYLNVSGQPVLAAAAPAAAMPPDLRSARIDARRTQVLTQTTSFKADRQAFFVNGRRFDINRVDERVAFGSIEEWTIRNDTDDLHAFHIHQLGFQVTEVNGVPAPFTGRVDTVRIPERGSIKIRLAFTQPEVIGRFVFHCHVLKHEDRGMMAQIEVYDPKPSGPISWISNLYLHIVWWMNGVPWSMCGLSTA
jgi:FtsP/CotA-like multicopper oxidase with cupredoxin domain